MLTVEGYARRGNERSDGMRVELRAEEQGGEEKIYDPPFPRSYVSRSFVSRACALTRTCTFNLRCTDRRENYETVLSSPFAAIFRVQV